MQVYELGYLILPSVAEDQLPSVVNSIKEIIAKGEGKVFDGEDPFKYDLSYTMSKTVGSRRYVVSDAYIGWLKFEAEPEAAALVKAGVEKMEEILRFLLIKAPRESAFTFEKAKALIAEKAAALESVAEEVAVIQEVVE